MTDSENRLNRLLQKLRTVAVKARKKLLASKEYKAEFIRKVVEGDKHD